MILNKQNNNAVHIIIKNHKLRTLGKMYFCAIMNTQGTLHKIKETQNNHMLSVAKIRVT